MPPIQRSRPSAAPAARRRPPRSRASGPTSSRCGRKPWISAGGRRTTDNGMGDLPPSIFLSSVVGLLLVLSCCPAGKTVGDRGGAFKSAAGAERGHGGPSTRDQGAARATGAVHRHG